jgi:hypothetical protein
MVPGCGLKGMESNNGDGIIYHDRTYLKDGIWHRTVSNSIEGLYLIG